MLPLLLLTLLQGPAMGKMAAPAAAVAAAAAALHCFATDTGAAALILQLLRPLCCCPCPANVADDKFVGIISLPWPLTSAAGHRLLAGQQLAEPAQPAMQPEHYSHVSFRVWFSLGYGMGTQQPASPLPPSYAKASRPWAYRATPIKPVGMGVRGCARRLHLTMPAVHPNLYVANATSSKHALTSEFDCARLL